MKNFKFFAAILIAIFFLMGCKSTSKNSIAESLDSGQAFLQANDLETIVPCLIDRDYIPVKVKGTVYDAATCHKAEDNYDDKFTRTETVCTELIGPWLATFVLVKYKDSAGIHWASVPALIKTLPEAGKEILLTIKLIQGNEKILVEI